MPDRSIAGIPPPSPGQVELAAAALAGGPEHDATSGGRGRARERPTRGGNQPGAVRNSSIRLTFVGWAGGAGARVRSVPVAQDFCWWYTGGRKNCRTATQRTALLLGGGSDGFAQRTAQW